MSYFIWTILILFCFTAFPTAPFFGQNQPTELQPKAPVSFSFLPDETRTFSLLMNEDGYAEITWLANDDLVLSFAFVDSSGRALEVGDSTEHESAVFIAPKAGEYSFLVKYEKASEVQGPQRVSLEYVNTFKLPVRSKQKGIRRVNGYDVRVMYAPGADITYGESLVLFEKGGKLKKLLKIGGNETYIGFSFADTSFVTPPAKVRRSNELIRRTADKTGDGVPDIMIDYFSGGAHCCSSTYFVNLGDAVELVEVVETEHSGMTAIAVNPKGGLRFETNENSFAYWNFSFAGSPMPTVILEFTNGELRPNFELMRKNPPPLATLKAKARTAALKIKNDPYTDEGGDFEEAFWDEMLDLIYTGNETLAWQYFDLVWPARKPGKELFLRDFKEQLAQSYYGSKDINTSNSFRNYMRLFEKTFQRELRKANQ